MGHTLSMSRLHLATLCAWSFRDGVELAPRVVGVPARFGTRYHSRVESLVLGTELEPLDDDEVDDDLAETFASNTIEALGLADADIILCERGIAYDAENDTAREVPARNSGEPYGAGPMELPGTVDLVLRDPDGVLHVIDIKSGKKSNTYELQIKAQAVAVSRLLGEDRVRASLFYARKCRPTHTEPIELDGERLEEEGGRIYGLLKSLPTVQPTTGDHCWRCDARGSCPAYQIQEVAE